MWFIRWIWHSGMPEWVIWVSVFVCERRDMRRSTGGCICLHTDVLKADPVLNFCFRLHFTFLLFWELQLPICILFQESMCLNVFIVNKPLHTWVLSYVILIFLNSLMSQCSTWKMYYVSLMWFGIPHKDSCTNQLNKFIAFVYTWVEKVRRDEHSWSPSSERTWVTQKTKIKEPWQYNQTFI